jgi:hypothetical protein
MARLPLCVILAAWTSLSAINVGAETVHIGISTPGCMKSHGNRPAQRLLPRENLDVRKVVIRTNLQVPALIGRRARLLHVSGIIARASIQGLPVKGVMGWFDRPLHILIAKPGFKRLTDFKGKRIGVSGWARRRISFCAKR